MIFMLIRTALWGLAIIATAAAFVWMKDSGGGVSMTLGGRIYGPFSLIETVAIIGAIALTLWFLIRLFGFLVALVRFFSGDETALSRFWRRSRERRGFDAVTNSLIAAASGDGRAALSRARKAERMLDRPGLTRLVVARAAEAAGDRATAKDYYKRLAEEEKTAYIGVRGLLDQAIADGDRAGAAQLGETAFALGGRQPELLTSLFELQCEKKNWEGARRTLDAAVKTGGIPKDVANRRSAVLLVTDAREAEARGDKATARELVERARRLAPSLTPATVIAAQQYAEAGDRSKATRLLRNAWKSEPHPDLAAAFAALAPDETPSRRRHRFRDLTKALPDHAESRLLTAELALADNDAPAARKAMGDLAKDHPTARAFALMAAISKADGGEEAEIRGWLARAISAPRDAQWTCGNCGQRHSEWTPVCTRCDAFDTLNWTNGEGEGAASEQDSSLLPVLAGADVAEMAAEKPEAGAAPEDAKKAAEKAAS